MPSVASAAMQVLHALASARSSDCACTPLSATGITVFVCDCHLTHVYFEGRWLGECSCYLGCSDTCSLVHCSLPVCVCFCVSVHFVSTRVHLKFDVMRSLGVRAAVRACTASTLKLYNLHDGHAGAQSVLRCAE
ncbi:hypothetical protein TRVL_06689 [Trypanosoma vivax]|nr:hypothetical protein TRVL_06689 [Trypanosoma vivax]